MFANIDRHRDLSSFDRRSRAFSKRSFARPRMSSRYGSDIEVKSVFPLEVGQGLFDRNTRLLTEHSLRLLRTENAQPPSMLFGRQVGEGIRRRRNVRIRRHVNNSYLVYYSNMLA